MKRKSTIMASLMFLLSVVLVQAQTPEVCNSVLQFTGRNISSQASERDKRSFVFQQACKNKYKDATQSARLGIDAVIEAVPVGIDAGYDNRVTKVENWCKQNTELEFESERAASFNNFVYGPSIAAWDSCIKANTTQIRIEPTLIDDSMPLFTVTNQVNGGQTIEIRGISISNSSTTCKVSSDAQSTITVNSNSEMSKVNIQPLKTASISCTRQSEKKTIDNSEAEIIPEVSISIITSMTNYQIKLPIKRAVLVSENKMNDILTRLSKLENQTFVGNACMRMNKIQICWGEKTMNPTDRKHIYEFNFEFEREFAATPNITPTVRLNGNQNQMMSIDQNISTEKNLKVRVQNSYPEGNNGIVQGTVVTVSYVAVGTAKD